MEPILNAKQFDILVTNVEKEHGLVKVFGQVDLQTCQVSPCNFELLKPGFVWSGCGKVSTISGVRAGGGARAWVEPAAGWAAGGGEEAGRGLGPGQGAQSGTNSQEGRGEPHRLGHQPPSGPRPH